MRSRRLSCRAAIVRVLGRPARCVTAGYLHFRVTSDSNEKLPNIPRITVTKRYVLMAFR
jgi:hypothetical protein